MRGGGPVKPRFCCDPMYTGFTSSCVSSCVRTIRGVNSITMSVCPFDRSLLVKSCLNMGSRIRPGKATEGPALVLAQQPGQQRRLAVAQPERRLDLARSE